MCRRWLCHCRFRHSTVALAASDETEFRVFVNTLSIFLNGTLFNSNAERLPQRVPRLLSRDLICGFFADEPPQEDNEPRRDEVSLNLTVTSRDSKSHLHGTDEKQYMDPNYLINLALSGADKLNSLSVASTHG